MILARVCGTVVATRCTDGVPAARYLLANPTDQHGAAKSGAIIALDTVGAGIDELVLVAQGSSARQTAVSDKKAIDAVIIGIVDLVEETGTVTYRK
ncbi:MAG: ethanolamine utilization protein EutN [Spirochaetaceae bacterium]|nr:MAG: ethanolamine utilization protein EutN [Spirochaetaceae bacterium]